jgi:hypothetical protein
MDQTFGKFSVASPHPSHSPPLSLILLCFERILVREWPVTQSRAGEGRVGREALINHEVRLGAHSLLETGVGCDRKVLLKHKLSTRYQIIAHIFRMPKQSWLSR